MPRSQQDKPFRIPKQAVGQAYEKVKRNQGAPGVDGQSLAEFETGLQGNLHQIGCELVAMACELTAWMQKLALHGPARAWELKRLRLRLFSAAGRLVHGGRRLRLRIAATWPWATQITAAITRLQALAPG